MQRKIENGQLKNKYKCAIFDLGYTLVEHNDEIETKDLAQILDIPYCTEFKNEIASFWKNSGKYTADSIITKDFYYNLIEKHLPYIKRFNISPQNFFDALCAKSEVGAYPCTEEILKHIFNKNIKIYGLSNWFKDDQIKELKNLKIEGYFEDVLGWDHSYAKPNPTTIKKHILSQYNNNEVILVGNDLQIDIRCAINAKIDSVWANYNHEKNETNIQPTYTIQSLKELKEII